MNSRAPEGTITPFKLTWRRYEICLQISTLPRMDAETGRLMTFVRHLREATEMADARNFDNAKSKLAAAMKSLEGMVKSGTMYPQLYKEGKNIQEIMASEVCYNKRLPYILSVLSSHQRQRPTATGGESETHSSMYETSTSRSYVERACSSFPQQPRAG